MSWERRFHQAALKGLYAIERGKAAEVSSGIKELAKQEDPSKNAKPVKNEKVVNPVFWVEIVGHFIEFELWEDENKRNIITIHKVK